VSQVFVIILADEFKQNIEIGRHYFITFEHVKALAEEGIESLSNYSSIIQIEFHLALTIRIAGHRLLDGQKGAIQVIIEGQHYLREDFVPEVDFKVRSSGL
jgi:hypothetical protein